MGRYFSKIKEGSTFIFLGLCGCIFFLILIFGQFFMNHGWLIKSQAIGYLKSDDTNKK